jgi:hypothetical protein
MERREGRGGRGRGNSHQRRPGTGCRNQIETALRESERERRGRVTIFLGLDVRTDDFYSAWDVIGPGIERRDLQREERAQDRDKGSVNTRERN